VYSFGSSRFYIKDVVGLLTLPMRTVADHIRLSRKRLALAPGEIDVHVIERRTFCRGSISGADPKAGLVSER